MKTKIFLVLIISVAALISFYQCDKREDITIPDKVYTPQELVKISKSGGTVTAGMEQATRQKMLDDLIASDQGGQWSKATPKPQDTTNVEAVFQLYKIPTMITSYHVAYRLMIFNGLYQPYIHSMCFIVRNSAGIEPIEASIKLEQPNYLDFPPQGHGSNTVLYHCTPTATYFVFFSLDAFQLEFANRIILDLWYYNPNPTAANWITVDRSDPNNFALSSDGYYNYPTYFFPDTLHLIYP